LDDCLNSSSSDFLQCHPEKDGWPWVQCVEMVYRRYSIK
jgi:hypothetical protein